MKLSCVTCRLIFSNNELFHKHYKTDWHRYNLKRRLAELPSIAKEEFEKKAESSKEIPGSKPPSRRKRLVDVKKIDKPVEEEDGDRKNCDKEKVLNEENLTVETNDCLFCNHQSRSTEGNVNHMQKRHSFFVPDKEKLVHLDKFVGFLAIKVHFGICLWCNGRGKQFKNVESLKKHMIDKGHCKILFDGKTKSTYKQFYQDGEIGAEEIEEVEEFDDEEYDDSNEEEENIENLLKAADYEVKLPSGAVLGHRSLAVYYKQNLKPVNSDTQEKVKKYKSLGYTGVVGPLEPKVARNMVLAQNMKQKYNLKLAIKTNKFQPHFRPEN